MQDKYVPMDFERFSVYMLVGGMPQAVEAYIETNNFWKVDEIKHDIFKCCEDD